MDSPANRYILATWFRRLTPTIVICTAGRTPAASPDHHQGHLLVEAARFYSQLTKWDDRFDGTAPYRVPHLVYAPFPFEAEVRHYHGSFVVDVTTTFEQKMEAIACYSSQFDESRFAKVRHFVSGNNISVGGRCGFAYGEFFALPTVIGTSEPFTLVMGGKATAALRWLAAGPASVAAAIRGREGWSCFWRARVAGIIEPPGQDKKDVRMARSKTILPRTWSMADLLKHFWRHLRRNAFA